MLQAQGILTIRPVPELSNFVEQTTGIYWRMIIYSRYNKLFLSHVHILWGILPVMKVVWGVTLHAQIIAVYRYICIHMQQINTIRISGL